MVVKEVVALGVLCLLSGITLAYLLLYILPFGHNKSKCVAVLVLGDLGRSPRMQNHAVALANAGWKVELIGFKGNFPALIANLRCGSLWGCAGVERQDSCQLPTLDTESAYDWRKSTLPCVWTSESAVPNIFTPDTSTPYSSIFIYPCAGTPYYARS